MILTLTGHHATAHEWNEHGKIYGIGLSLSCAIVTCDYATSRRYAAYRTNVCTRFSMQCASRSALARDLAYRSRVSLRCALTYSKPLTRRVFAWEKSIRGNRRV